MTLLTAQQVAEMIGSRSAKWVYEKAAEGVIPSIRISAGTLRFDEKDIVAWLESLKKH